ncbi:hypothetical protein PMAYCL1PPCAC_00241, partial [Pristionchus mayeri]
CIRLFTGRFIYEISPLFPLHNTIDDVFQRRAEIIHALTQRPIPSPVPVHYPTPLELYRRAMHFHLLEIGIALYKREKSVRGLDEHIPNSIGRGQRKGLTFSELEKRRQFSSSSTHP